jgi:hypothetical protein
MLVVMNRDAEGYFDRSDSPPALRLVRWAFSNPEKIAAVGFGLIAFGLSMFYFESRKESDSEKALERRTLSRMGKKED